MKLPKNLNPIYPPFGKYQVEAIAYGAIHQNVGLLLPLGSGKTYSAINICRHRIQYDKIKKILILCPPAIMIKWQKEIFKFSEYKAIILHHETRKKRIQKIKQFINQNIHFGIINYEGLAPYLKYLKQIPLDCIIADESARYIKSHTANRTGASIILSKQAKYHIILTGTPIANKPMDLWSQFMFLDNGKTFGTNFYSWRNYFFYKMRFKRFTKWQIKKDKIFILNKKIYNTCIRFTTEEIFPNLPKIMSIRIDLKMSEELEKIYNKVKKQIISEIEVEEGKAKLNIKHIFTKLIRLQQVTSGYIKDENNIIKTLKYTPKLDAVIEEIKKITDTGESVIVWCRFRHTIRMIEERLNIKYIVMTGDDSSKEKDRKWNTFQKSKINVFIGQIRAGGIGIELFKLNSTDQYQHMIFVENTFVLDDKEQATGRSYGRIGQKSKVRVIDFIIENTIDEKIYSTLENNKQIADEILKKGISEFLK